MKRRTITTQILLLTLLLILLFPHTLGNSTLPPNLDLDDGGRQISMSTFGGQIYATTEAGSFLIYALDPDALLGWNRGVTPELQFAIDPKHHNLPTLGTWDQEYCTIRSDLISKENCDLIIHYAPINPDSLDLADRIETKLGIPVVLLDNSLHSLPATLDFLGQLLGRELRGQALATFVGNHLDKLAKFQELQSNYTPIPVHIVSPCKLGFFDELLNLAKMIEIPVWKEEPPLPDFVFIMPDTISDPYKEIEKDGHKRIFQIPTFPSNWLEPGSLFSLLGLEWLHTIAYPTAYNADLAETYKAFMEIFFEVTITPELLDWTFKRSGITY